MPFSISPQRDGPNGVIAADMMGWFATCPLQYLPAWILTRSSGTTSDYLFISPEDWVRLLGNRRNINPPHRDHAREGTKSSAFFVIPVRSQSSASQGPQTVDSCDHADRSQTVHRTPEAQSHKCLWRVVMVCSHHTSLQSSRKWFPTPPVGKLSQETSEDTTLCLHPGSVSHHIPGTRVPSLPCFLTATTKSRPHGT